jgi:hypothetical protein
MAVLPNAQAVSSSVLGYTVKKSYPLVVETKTLYTVTGIVLVTSIVGYVSTVITVANTVKLQANPTVGTTSDLCAATDIGTTDTPAGNLLGWSGSPAESLITGVGAVAQWPVTEASGSPATGTQTGGVNGIYLAAGTIEQVTATGADGAIDWYVSYVPISSDGKIVAA